MNNRLTKIVRHICLMAVTLTAVSITALAQTDAARIQGNIADSAGAVVTGATVVAKNLGNNREVSAISNDNGQYTLVGLSPGRYQITVSLTGFKTINQEITVQIQQVAVINFAVEPGEVSEVVQVDAEAPLVDSATSAVGDVVTGERLIDSPINGRNMLELARLIPGVTQGVRNGFATGSGGNAETYRNRNTGGAALSVNGQRTQANNFMIDGVDNNESLVNSIALFPSVDAIAEFKVTTSIAPAEVGRGGGAIINTTLKSGANKYFGSAFLFVRNSIFDAAESFPVGRAKDHFRRGQFGATLGGPISFPKYGENGFPMWSGKDKLFFFFSYEGLRQFLPASSGTATVPTALMRTGNYSEVDFALKDPLDGRRICNDPANPECNGTPYNRLDLLPGNRMNVAGRNYLNAFPLPNLPNAGLYNNYFWVMNEDLKSNTYNGKIDWHLNDRHRIGGTVNWSKWTQTSSSKFTNLPSGYGSGSNPTNTKSLILAYNAVLAPSVTNEFRVQAMRHHYDYTPPLYDRPVSRDLGFTWSNPETNPELYGGVAIGAYDTGNIEYTGDGGAYKVPQNTYQLSDSITWLKGNHILKAGASLIRREVGIYQGNRMKGEFGFWSGDPLSTGWVSADMLVGFAQFYWAGSYIQPVGTRSWENGFFIQDDWKVNKHLTLNLGLRYDLLTMPTEHHGRQANFDLQNRQLVVARDGGDSMVDTDWGNWGPRVGFAYDLSGKGRSVLRGGFGIFYYLDRGGVANQLISNPPFRGAAQYGTWGGYRFTFSGMAPNNSTDPRLATAPLPVIPPPSEISLTQPMNLGVIAILPDIKNSRTYQYDIQFQQQIWGRTALTIGYQGNRGGNLSVYYNPNDNVVGQPNSPRPYEGWNVTVRDDAGRSSYDALQAKLERRYSNGLWYLASYTYSSSRDTSNGAWDNPYGFADVGNVDLNFGRSIIDYPHVFSFSSSWEVPFGKNRKFGSNSNRFVDTLLGGWQLAPIFRLQSGDPFDIRDRFGNLVDLVGDPYSGNDSPYLNWNAFQRVSFSSGSRGDVPDRVGNMERNSLRKPMNWSLNLGIYKSFAFSESSKLQFRFQAYNITNQPQRRGLSTWMGNDNATTPPNEWGKWYETINYSSRKLEFGLRLEF